MTSLDQLALHQPATVTGVQAGDAAMTPELLRRLAELGFLPGERVRVVARGVPGGTPLAVRIGNSTFALRLIEARSVQIKIESAT
jgi:ferrous iron transport protein A